MYLEKINDVVDDEVLKKKTFNTLQTKLYCLQKQIPYATTLIHINQYNIDKQILEK